MWTQTTRIASYTTSFVHVCGRAPYNPGDASRLSLYLREPGLIQSKTVNDATVIVSYCRIRARDQDKLNTLHFTIYRTDTCLLVLRLFQSETIHKQIICAFNLFFFSSVYSRGENWANFLQTPRNKNGFKHVAKFFFSSFLTEQFHLSWKLKLRRLKLYNELRQKADITDIIYHLTGSIRRRIKKIRNHTTILSFMI